MYGKDLAPEQAMRTGDFASRLSAMVRAVAAAFRVLHRIQYGEPWDGAPPLAKGSLASTQAHCR